MTDVDLEVADAFERIFPVPAMSDDWDDVLQRSGWRGRKQASRVSEGGRRRRVLVVAAVSLFIAVASASAFGTVQDLIFGERRSASAGAPTWSSDGQRIAFVTIAVRQGLQSPVELNVMDADGSAQRNLTREWSLELDPGSWLYAGLPVWSPDWRQLALVRARGVYRTHRGSVERYSDIYVMNADGSGLRRLTRSPQHDGDPAWSPDGRRLAFVRVQGGRSDIYVVDADGRGLRSLAHAIMFRPSPGAPSSGFAANPTWSPDGERIAFMSNRDGTDDIFVVNADGSGLRNLTRSQGDRTRMWHGRQHERIFWSSPHQQWSPDGRKIVFRSERDRPSELERAACRPRCRRDEIYVINADGSGRRRLTHNWRSDGAPMWSPDGRKIVFVRSGWESAGVQGDVYVVNADGSGERNLTRSVTRPLATDTAPAWSPDGRKILFVSNRDRNGEIYVMNADGSGLRKLTRLRGGD
jgi:Tol biopolymer transport system component